MEQCSKSFCATQLSVANLTQRHKITIRSNTNWNKKRNVLGLDDLPEFRRKKYQKLSKCAYVATQTDRPMLSKREGFAALARSETKRAMQCSARRWFLLSRRLYWSARLSGRAYGDIDVGDELPPPGSQTQRLRPCTPLRNPSQNGTRLEELARPEKPNWLTRAVPRCHTGPCGRHYTERKQFQVAVCLMQLGDNSLPPLASTYLDPTHARPTCTPQACSRTCASPAVEECIGAPQPTSIIVWLPPRIRQ